MQNVIRRSEILADTTNINALVGELFAASLPSLALHSDWVVFTCSRDEAKDFLIAFDDKVTSPFLFMLTMSYKLLGAQASKVTCF